MSEISLPPEYEGIHLYKIDQPSTAETKPENVPRFTIEEFTTIKEAAKLLQDPTTTALQGIPVDSGAKWVIVDGSELLISTARESFGTVLDHKR